MAVIWGLVGRKIFLNATAPDEVAALDTGPIQELKPIVKDTFSLIELDRDPFLGIVSRNRESRLSGVSKNRNTKPANKNNKKEVVKWPQVTYFGLVKKGSSKNELALVKINNKTYHVKKNDLIDETIKIRKVFRDSIEIQFNKEKKHFKKQ